MWGTYVTDWYKLDAGEAAQRLKTEPVGGLSEGEAQARLAQYGPNELTGTGIKSVWTILWEQLTSIMVVVLIIAAGISAALGLVEVFHKHVVWSEELTDAIAIAVIVILNAILGVHQEYRAEKAMAALKKLAVPKVKVRRDRQVREIPSTQAVPGDVLLLEAGNLVPADCRLVEAANLRIQEAALTGESEPVEKVVRSLPDRALPLGDRVNMAYMGTVVTYGRGTGLICETGMSTELGSIAGMIQSVQRDATPLQKRLDQLGKWLAVAALALVGIIFVQGLIRGGTGLQNLKEMFLIAVSMAVAAVPEGLPAVVTIALALGAQRMLKRRALIRKLLAVETLGSVTVICSDKTGTLTENRMTVTVLDVAGHRLDLIEHLKAREAVMDGSSSTEVLREQPAMALLLAGAALCNDATLTESERESGRAHALGDPTEGALVVAAAHMGLWKGELEAVLPRRDELPFDSDRKRMTTVHELPESGGMLPDVLGGLRGFAGKSGPARIGFTKGAVDALVLACDTVLVNSEVCRLDDAMRGRIAASNDELARSGMRVLGVAARSVSSDEPAGPGLESGMTFVGLVGMIDPPRAEVKNAVATCKSAGIRPIMITGDHPLTAIEIARQLNIADSGSRVLTGSELDHYSVEDLEAVVEDVPVYARVSPEHKLKIVQALQNRGHVAAMTGDGVNDAPALKKADIGVAMGITGTDVAKEASDMVLQDDNFATIVAAVEEGRTIYDNIRKFIKYLLSCNSGELWVMLLSPVLGLPLPLLPLQILWMNLVTDGLPALALGLEPAERNIMRRPPNRTTESVFAGGVGWMIIWAGALMGAVSLALGWGEWQALAEAAASYREQYYRTMVFTSMTLTQMGMVLAMRSHRDSIFRIGLMSNGWLVGAVLLTFVLQLLLVYVGPLQRLFNTVALSASDLGVCLLLSTSVFWAIELEKWLRRRARSG